MNQDVEIEEYLLSNSFSSYDKANHANLKSNNVPTSFMKNSPSIKALENILNEKSRSFNYNLNNLSVQSMQSIQSFQTASETLPTKLDRIDASPLSHNDSTVNENDNDIEHDLGVKKDDHSRSLNVEDNDDTLIDDSSVHITPTQAHAHQQASIPPKSQLQAQQQQSKYVKMPSLIPADIKERTFQESTNPNYRRSMVDIPEEPAGHSLRTTPKLPSSSSTPQFNSFGKFSDLETPKRDTSLNPGTPSPRKSPHIRSSSAFNLNIKKDSPQKHKRSNTLSDLTNLKNENSVADKKPKFSFKALFRKKDKKKEEPKKAKESKSDKKDKKVNIPASPKEPPKQSLPMSPESPVSQPYNSKIRLPADRMSDTKTFKSNTNINFIREVTEDFNDTAIDEFNDDYDSNNLISNPPIKITGNHKYGNEMILEPSPMPKSNNPFVNYSRVEPTSKNKDNESIDDIFGSPTRRTSLSDNHLGDALFPKSLNPQEVESIVSLERSRSMKSVKSSKRTSFVNYDGSDDNIILFNDQSFSSNLNSPVTSNVSRNNSILKNKSAKYNSIDSKFSSQDENLRNLNTMNGSESSLNNNNILVDGEFDDLMEFSDFINFDSVDLDSSPINLGLDEPEVSVATPVSFSRAELTLPAFEPPAAIQGNNDSPIVISSSSTSIVEDMDESNISEEPPLNLSPSTPEITVSHQNFDSQLSPELQNTLSPESLIARKPMNEKNSFRPISMSFKGLKGPSFQNKISEKSLRTSDSHQSFNISFNDDSDYSGSAVGGGFGSSDEEDAEDEQFYETESEHEFDSREDTYDNYGYDTEEEELDKENYESRLPLPSPPKIAVSQSTYGSPTASTRGVQKKNPRQRVEFSSRIILYETYNSDEYDRHPDIAACNQLTPALAQFIKAELNELKASMPIHEESRCYIHFY